MESDVVIKENLAPDALISRLADATEEEITQYATVCRAYCESVDPEALVGNLSGHMALQERIVRPSLHKVIKDHDSVLDFACGIGRLTRVVWDYCLIHRVGHVVGVDVSRRALARAAQIVPRATFVAIPGDGSLPFPPESFSVVVSTIALQHIQFFPVRHRYFREFARVLRPGGHLLVQLNADDSGKHIRWFERGTPDLYTAPDVVCTEEEIGGYLPQVGFTVHETWRTEMDTAAVSWERRETGKPDGWLWVWAQKDGKGGK